MARPRTQGPQTRAKILDVAQELFVSQGYDKTSLRDIAERLGITKAALYYYFERKEEILLELHLRLHAIGSQALDEIEGIPDGPERVAAWPNLIDRLIELMLQNRDMLLLHRRNAGAMEMIYENERNKIENEDLERRLGRILSSPVITLETRVRMASTVGVLTEVLVESGTAFDDVPPEQLAEVIRGVVADLLAPSLASDT